jgi:hypothetical protein
MNSKVNIADREIDTCVTPIVVVSKEQVSNQTAREAFRISESGKRNKQIASPKYLYVIGKACSCLKVSETPVDMLI